MPRRNHAPAIESANSLQTWLYFGLLGEVLDTKIDRAQFRTEDVTGDACFSSSSIGPLLSAWSQQIAQQTWSHDQIALKAWSDRIWNLTWDVRQIVIRTVRALTLHRLSDSPSQSLSRVCLSIAALGEYIVQVLVDVCIHRDVREPNDQNWRHFGYADCGRLVWEMMVAQGWCPHKLAQYDSENKPSIGKLWYFANSRPPRADKTHQKCTVKSCVWLQADVATYQTKHSEENCDCEWYGPAVDKLANGIRCGKQQAVVVNEGFVTGQVHLSLQDISTGMPYVAISHVWADGHGNLTHNTLPQCTLRKIREYVNGLPRQDTSRSMPFWMDTLCLPRYPIEVRRKALQTLNEPFKRATYVLVIDSYLTGVPVKDMEPIEILARVTACDWNQRLWTFLEGRVGRSIWFQFRDRAVNLHDAVMIDWRRTHFNIPSLPSNGVETSMIGAYMGTQIIQDGVVGRLWNEIPSIRIALKTRATSRAADEPLCLGALLGLEMERILASDDAKKMQVLWSLMEKVPVGLVFSNAPKKLTGKGFRWAPSSLMGALDVERWEGSNVLIGELTAKPSSEGLFARLPGLLFPASHEKDTDNGRILVLRSCDAKKVPMIVRSFCSRAGKTNGTNV